MVGEIYKVIFKRKEELFKLIPIIVTIYGYTTLYDYFGGSLFTSSLAKIIEPIPFVYYISVILLIKLTTYHP